MDREVLFKVRFSSSGDPTTLPNAKNVIYNTLSLGIELGGIEYTLHYAKNTANQKEAEVIAHFLDSLVHLPPIAVIRAHTRLNRDDRMTLGEPKHIDDRE